MLVDYDGKKYFAKTSVLQEMYPLANKSSICDDLQFKLLPGIPVLASLYSDPANLDVAIPTAEELVSIFLNEGKPCAVSGNIVLAKEGDK